MTRRVWRRLCLLIARQLFTLAMVITVAAAMLAIALAVIPGDPLTAVMGQRAAGLAPQPASFREVLETFAFSTHYDGTPVIDIVLGAIPVTLIISLGALAAATPPAVALGLMAAGAGRRASTLATTLFTLCISAPSALAAVGLIYLLTFTLKVTPTSGWNGATSAIAPVLTLAIPAFGHVGRTAWALASDVFPSVYIRTARAKGLSRTQVAWSHVLPNIAAPLIAFLAASFASLLSGTLLVETLFSLPGLGLEMVAATKARDYPVIMGCMFTMIILNIIAGILSELFIFNISSNTQDLDVRDGVSKAGWE